MDDMFGGDDDEVNTFEIYECKETTIVLEHNDWCNWKEFQDKSINDYPRYLQYPKYMNIVMVEIFLLS